MFTLKVIYDVRSGLIRSDSQHEFGGTDLMQVHAFRHLFPEEYCKWVFRALLTDLAGLHGWAVEIRKVNDEQDETSTDAAEAEL